MFAVIKTGGKQYRVVPDDLLKVDRLAGEVGSTVLFPEVLMIGGDDGVTLGTPVVAGASVAVEVVEHSRAATVITFKKRRRQNSKRRRGHRQHLTIVRIAEILTDGRAPTPAEAKTAAAAKAKVAPAKTQAAKPAAGGAKKAAPVRKPRAKAEKTSKAEKTAKADAAGA